MVKRKRGDARSKSSLSDAKTSKQPTPDKPGGTEVDTAGKTVRFDVPFENKAILCERKGPEMTPALVFTHGAAGTIDSPALQDFLAGLPTYVCFQGNPNMKSRVKSFHAVIEHIKAPKVLGGRSMGARAAVVTALEMTEKPEALVLVSYPLTGGKDGRVRETAREQILLDLPEEIDVLFAIGSKDHSCSLELLRDVIRRMKATTWLVELKEADHGLTLKQKAGVRALRAETGSIAADWLKHRDHKKRFCAVSWDAVESRITTQGWQTLEDPRTTKKRQKV